MYVYNKNFHKDLPIKMSEFKNIFQGYSFYQISIYLVVFQLYLNFLDLDSFLKDNLETFLDRTHRITFQNGIFKMNLMSVNDQSNLENEECSNIQKGIQN